VTPTRYYELAYCCRIFGVLAGEDSSSADFREATGSSPDLRDPGHRDALLRWLRRWGCRHLRRDDNALASEALREWGVAWEARLPAREVTLDHIDNHELDVLAGAYGALAELPAGFRAGRREPIPVRFGATAAAKALYALRPEACPPWDEPIRAHHGWDGSAPSYRAALERARAELAEAAESAGVAVAELPALIGRPGSSPPRLVDEHDWLRVTRGHEPPRREELERWWRSSA
jgi:hypothetical protein